MWCVLRKNTLSAYTDDINEKDMKHQFHGIHSVAIKNRGFFQKFFEMFYTNPHRMFTHEEQFIKLQIDCDEEDFFRWKAAFISAEMLVEQSVSEIHVGFLIINLLFYSILYFYNFSMKRKLAAKTELARQIEEIHSFAGFYFRIVMKKMIDTTPKVIVMMLVKNCTNYIQNGLFADLQLSGQMVRTST
jgi:Dynamin GTPase effector domain